MNPRLRLVGALAAALALVAVTAIAVAARSSPTQPPPDSASGFLSPSPSASPLASAMCSTRTCLRSAATASLAGSAAMSLRSRSLSARSPTAAFSASRTWRRHSASLSCHASCSVLTQRARYDNSTTSPFERRHAIATVSRYGATQPELTRGQAMALRPVVHDDVVSCELDLDSQQIRYRIQNAAEFEAAGIGAGDGSDSDEYVTCFTDVHPVLCPAISLNVLVGCTATITVID